MGKYIIEVDESEIIGCWNEQATKELGYQEYALKQCPKIKVKPYNPTGDCISREDLKEDFKSRLALCNEWIEKAKDKETKIRASAVKSYIAEVIMTIDNAPTVEITEEMAINKLHETGWLIGHDKEMTTRPQGEYIRVDNLWAKCSICGNLTRVIKKYNMPNFCPACGADMKGDTE